MANPDANLLSKAAYDTIAVVGLSGGGLDAQVMRGFNLFRRSGRPWVLDEAGHLRQYLDRVLNAPGRYAGVLANVTDQAFAQQLIGTGLPTVDLSGFVRDVPFTLVTADNRAVGAMAADYFLSRQFEHFAFVSNARYPFESHRWAGYRDRLADCGHEADWFALEGAWHVDAAGEQRRFSNWLQKLDALPKPLAVLAASDRVGVNVCDACRALDIAVPEQVAVLGVDNNEYLCESCEPPLSSVELPGEKIGYEAGRILRARIEGEGDLKPHYRFDPVGVITRKSTEITAIADEPIARALNWMRERAMQRITIAQVAEAVGLDRRTFYRRFEKAVGRKPLDELYRLRVELAKHRLAATTQSVYTIAIDCGFGDADTFNRRFKQHVAMTPSQYRKQFSLR